jgi:hypothetical protein
LPNSISAPVSRTDPGNIALTVAAVPTGMNAGVRISPREVRIVPVRALPSVPVSENENGVMTAVMPCETENAKPAN